MSARPVDPARTAEGAARRRIQHDLNALNPAARERYRAALRRLLRDADAAAGAAPSRPRPPRVPATVFILGMVAAGAATLAASHPAAAAAAAVAVLAMLRVLLRRSAAAPDAGEPEPTLAPYSPERALALHLAAMAASRRAYYLDENPAGPGALTRKA